LKVGSVARHPPPTHRLKPPQSHLPSASSHSRQAVFALFYLLAAPSPTACTLPDTKDATDYLWVFARAGGTWLPIHYPRPLCPLFTPQHPARTLDYFYLHTMTCACPSCPCLAAPQQALRVLPAPQTTFPFPVSVEHGVNGWRWATNPSGRHPSPAFRRPAPQRVRAAVPFFQQCEA
jgi:hypothetical protein